MIRELTIENFRALRELHLAGLGRVNLLVGANNSGKTSVLEAIAFLASGGDPWQVYRALSRRNERAVDGERDISCVDVRHLFFGRKIGDDVSATIAGIDTSGGAVSFRLSTPRVPAGDLAEWQEIVARTTRLPLNRSRPEPGDIQIETGHRAPRHLSIEAPAGKVILLPLRPPALLNEILARRQRSEQGTRIAFVATTGVPASRLADLYEQLLLTPEEAAIIAALREVESGIVRLATRGTTIARRDFIVGMAGATEPVPLGSLGDGVHRMLAIALSLVSARGGHLLIDEIDTGLHHTVMQKMWRLVFETAKRLDVTVFATTHSYDCVHALAAIARPDIREGGEVSLVRIERDNPRAIHFTEEEISHLADWQIEAR